MEVEKKEMEKHLFMDDVTWRHGHRKKTSLRNSALTIYTSYIVVLI